MRTSWIVLGSAFTAAVLLAGAFQVVVLGVPVLGDTATEHQTFTRPITKLVVDGTSTDVEVRGSDQSDVKLTRKLRWHTSKPEYDETWDGTVLTLRPLDCDGIGSCQLDYTVHLPHGTELEIRVASGDVDTLDLTTDQYIRSSSGDVSVSRGSGPVDVEASSGDVEVSTESPVSVAVRTSSGDIEIHLAPAEYDVEADAESGDVGVDVDRDGESPLKVLAKTSSGDIEVGYR